jgi:hypothetical protein
MGRMAIITIFACGMIMIYSPTSHAELWRCAETNGSAVFTDRPNASRGCEPYNLPITPSESKITVAPSIQTDGYFLTPEHRYNLKDFANLQRNEPDTFRGITPGMTESQVLKLAGYPDKRYRLPCDTESGGSAFCPKRWVYNYSDTWLVELTLDAGRVTEINKLRRP